MNRLLHILCALSLALLLFSCSNGPRVIPRGKMAKIYAEILVTDQWINSTPSVMRMADTSLVYEPILQKYGYTSADYRLSVEKYMKDPERYSKILRSTSEIIGKRLDELNRLKKELEESVIEVKTNFEVGDFFPYMTKEPYIHYYDSLSVECDSLGCYRFYDVQRSDTTYDGIIMNVRIDSLMVSDTLEEEVAPSDSIIIKTITSEVKDIYE